MPRTLSEVLSELAVAQRGADRDTSLIDNRFLPGHEMAKRECKEQVVALRAEYAKLLFSTAIGFFTQGSLGKAMEFAANAAVSCGSITFDANELYQKMTGPVEATMGSTREFNVNQISALISNIREEAMDLGLKGTLIAPTLKEMVSLPTSGAVTNYIKKLIQESSGNELMLLYAAKVITQRALDAKLDKTPAKIVILNANDSDLEALKSVFNIRRRLVNLTPDTVVDASFAIEKLTGKKAEKPKAVKQESQEPPA